MLVAASLAITITLGATHSMSHPCGARYGVPHGVANAINLPPVIEFNAVVSEEVADQFRDAAEVLGVDARGGGQRIGRTLADHVRELRGRLGLPGRLSEVGVPEEGISRLAEDAMGEGSTLVNPRQPSEEDFVELFQQAL